MIYEIIDNETDERYIGSTTQKQLSNRISGHRTHYKCWLNGKKKYNCSSFKILENDNWTYYLLEKYEYENKQQLRMKEREWIEKRMHENCIVVNKLKPFISKQESKEKNKEYNEKNREKRKEYNKEYYNNNKYKFVKDR